MRGTSIRTPLMRATIIGTATRGIGDIILSTEMTETIAGGDHARA